VDADAAREAVKKFWIALVLCALVCLSACGNRKSQAEQLAALDSAYQSGVLTKEEYDLKKAAIVGPAPQAPPVAAVPAAAAPVTPAAPAPPPEPPAPPAPVAKAVKPEQPEPEPAPSSGCEDAEYKSNKSGPQTRFFPMPVAKVKTATLAALATLDFTIHKDSGNEIEASKKRHIGVVIGAGGEREILHFEPAQQGGQKGTRVTGETKKSFTGRLAQKSWTGAVLAQTACNLR
jgi:hypothetical protein